MSDFFDRLKHERDELATRFEKLTEFFGTPQFIELHFVHRNLLIRQYESMRNYLDTLEERIYILELEEK